MDNETDSFNKILADKLKAAEKDVELIRQELAVWTTKLQQAEQRIQAYRRVYELEYGTGNHDNNKNASALFPNATRFVGKTLREASIEVLKEQGALHLSDVHRYLAEGGLENKKTTLVTVLIKGKDFERVEGKPNTFRLKKQMSREHFQSE